MPRYSVLVPCSSSRVHGRVSRLRSFPPETRDAKPETIILRVQASFVWIGEGEAHLQNQCVDLVFVLLARHRVGPPFQSPELVSLGAVRLAVAEHVEALHVPVIDRPLNSFFRLSAFAREFGAGVGAEVNVS